VSKELKQKLTSGHEITLEKTYYVEAQMKNSERWFKARILDYKLSKGKHRGFQKFGSKFLLFAIIANYRL
jgi:hypothetical protein